MSVWDEVDQWAKKSEADYLGTKARLEAIGFLHMSVTEYGVWRAKHRVLGWLTAPSGDELLRIATQKLTRHREDQEKSLQERIREKELQARGSAK